MKTIWIIVSAKSVTYGHGDYGTEFAIAYKNGYGCGEIHPTFTTKEKANEYLDTLQITYSLVPFEISLPEIEL